MSRKNITIGGVVVVIVGIVVVAALAYAFLRPTEEASGPLEAIPISANTPEVTDVDSGENEEDVADDDSDGQESAGTESESGAETGAGSEVPETPTSEPATPTPEPLIPPSEPVLYEITQDGSEARFYIDEVLRGNPKTVVGVTNQIAGQILYDAADPTSAQVGTILVNARTLATDSDGRNRAIGNQILQSGDYEFISFEPTAITGIPASVGPGESVTFEITGDLTIRDITTEVTFEVTVVPVSEDRLEGMASTTVLRGDYGLTIPNVPFVANVSEEVVLELDFVATQIGG